MLCSSTNLPVTRGLASALCLAVLLVTALQARPAVIADAPSAQEPRVVLAVLGRQEGSRRICAVPLGGRWGGRWHGPEKCGAKVSLGMQAPLVDLQAGAVGRFQVDETYDGNTVPPWERFANAADSGLGMPVGGSVRWSDARRAGYPMVAVLGADETATLAWPVTELPLTNTIYSAFARDWLVSAGVSRTGAEKVRLAQLMATDLNRDGRNEILLAYCSMEDDVKYGSRWDGEAGDFAGLIMRSVLSGTPGVHTQALYARIFGARAKLKLALPSPMAPWEHVPESYRIAAVIDADGDGVAEVVTQSRRQGDYAFELWRMEGGRLVSVGCWGDPMVGSYDEE